MTKIAMAASLLLPLLLAACSSETTMTNRLVSQDQQLTDLKRALDYGAISQSEYEKQREKVLEGK